VREIISLTRQSIQVVTTRARKVIFGYLFSLLAISSLDAAALFLLSRLFSTDSINNDSMTSTSTNSKLLVIIVFLFMLRSALSTISTWISLKEFADQEVQIGQRNLTALHLAPLEERIDLNVSDYFTAVDRGPTSLIQGFLISVVTICAELISGIVILGVVLFVQPATAIVAFVYFVLIAVVQHKFLSATQERAGEAVFTSGNRTYDLLTDYFQMNKLLQLNGSKSFDRALQEQRSALALARAKTVFISSLPRYFMESMLALGFLVIGGSTWLIEGEDAVVPALAIFAAAGFRLLPIVNRIQGLALTAIGSAPIARQGIAPLSIGAKSYSQMSTSSPNNSHDIMEVHDVSFSYLSGTEPALRSVSLSFKEGLQYAVVGPSGSGKTTLIDVCLGLLTPQEGKVLWKFDQPQGCFGYVPQDTYVAAASISANVALEWDASEIDLEKVRSALIAANLEEYLDSDLNDQKLSENFNKMSGGQRQRLGLARALYRDSRILVLDEATSALDTITESKVMETVDSLRGKTTVIIVAHRLTTIKNADQVIYIEGGRVQGVGSFAELQRKLPQFKEQVLLGQLTLSTDGP
jgi:ABC-type multidrug transport system fused ATPase/permease subunit